MYIEPKISKHKALLIQLDWWKPYFWPPFLSSVKILEDCWYFFIMFSLFGSLLSFTMSWSRKTDHRGFNLQLCILGLEFIFEIYDIRHWEEFNTEALDDLGIKVFGDIENFHKWLYMEHLGFKKKPIEILNQVNGEQLIFEELYRIAHGYVI